MGALKKYERYVIPGLEEAGPFFPTNDYLTYVYMVPSTRDVIYKNNTGIHIRKRPLDLFGDYVNTCVGELFFRMSDEEKGQFLDSLRSGKLDFLLEG